MDAKQVSGGKLNKQQANIKDYRKKTAKCSET